MTLPLRSPSSGRPLRPDTPHSLSDGAGERWPVLDAIPYLRTGREALVGSVLGRLDRGDEAGALALLLADQDDWFRGDAPSPDALRELVEKRDALTLREAMRHLGFGPVGDYFAHRWSDPTYLAGLALLEAHWNEPSTAFELACGIGHNLRALESRGVAVAGGDVVFAKLWLARHWVLDGEADLVCFDAAAPWPLEAPAFHLVLCHDAFYFLEPKAEILGTLRASVSRERGLLAIGHVHNRDYPNLSSGQAVTAEEMDRLFPDAVVYDDAELTRALAEGRAPRPSPVASLADAEAFSLVEGSGLERQPRSVAGGLVMPRPGATLIRNPLYAPTSEGAIEVAWPSERYAREYGPRATYPPRTTCPERAVSGAAVEALARRRELVELPERW